MAKVKNPSWLGGDEIEMFPRSALLKTESGDDFRAIFTYGLKHLNHPEIMIRLSAGIFHEMWEIIKLLIIKIDSGERLEEVNKIAIEEYSKTFQLAFGEYSLNGIQQKFIELIPIG